MTHADIRVDLDRALAATAAVVAAIEPGQWTAPTPCTELDVRAELNHLVRGNLVFVAIIRGEQWPAQGTDHLTTRPGGPGAPFAPEVPVPADAPAVDRLAGFLGRSV